MNLGGSVNAMVLRRSRRASRDASGRHGPDHDSLVDDLVSVLGSDRVLTSTAALRLYGHDASTFRGDAPPAVCLPTTTDEVAAVVTAIRRHGRPFVARGSGTGLAGGAVPLGDAVVIATTRMDRVLSIDAEHRVAWVQPGVLNLDLTRQLRPLGFHFAPDPSSQQACTIGGNVANNSGGPHCLAYGVTSAHVLAADVVLPDGTVARLGGEAVEPSGYDLRGVFVGSEGTLGIATAVAVRLTPNPEGITTMLAVFDDLDAAAASVSAIIAAGIVPAALEMMEGGLASVVEDFCGAGYPRDAAAVLLVELDGPRHGVADDAERVQRTVLDGGARSVRTAADDAEREALWRGRKSAFGAVARILPDYYLHDTVVPRHRLVEVLAEVRAIAARHDLVVHNVFHAGDGNLHPLLLFDSREPGIMERVHAAGDEIVAASLAAGGVLSGEHGIGLEKRDHMAAMFSPVDLEHQDRLRSAFDPDNVCNPDKVLPSGSRCGDLSAVPDGVWV